MAGLPAFAQPRVAASIKPLQLIAMAVTEGVSDPALVLDNSQDPHHPSLRPSQRRAMSTADVFLWVGPSMETGLEGAVSELGAVVITATGAWDMTVLQAGDRPDPHLWLDTRNAAQIAGLLANVLVDLDPANEERYLANLAAFRNELETLQRQIKGMLQPETFPPFAVYHNGYGYFENQFGLEHAASFTGNEEVQPGIRRILAVKSILDEKQVNCVIVSPSVNPDYLSNLIERDSMQYVTIDVLARDINVVKDGYVRFLRNIAEAFMTCRKS